jgi:hypothetical protein
MLAIKNPKEMQYEESPGSINSGDCMNEDENSKMRSRRTKELKSNENEIAN